MLQAKTKKQMEYRSKAKGLWGTRLYRIWYGIYARCYNKSNNQYCYYGQRGISMCDEWRNDILVFRDWAIANGYSEELTIDRIDNNGNYEPSNCRWASMREQSNNRRSNTHLSYKGQTHTMAEWSRITGISERSLWNRKFNCGWSDEKTLTTPCRIIHRKSSFSKEQKENMVQDRLSGLTYNDIAKKWGCNRHTVSEIIKELNKNIS